MLPVLVYISIKLKKYVGIQCKRHSSNIDSRVSRVNSCPSSMCDAVRLIIPTTQCQHDKNSESASDLLGKAVMSSNAKEKANDAYRICIGCPDLSMTRAMHEAPF